MNFNGPIVQWQNVSFATKRPAFDSRRVHHLRYNNKKRLHRLAVRTLGFHPRNRSSTLLGGAIRCLGSSIGRAADSRRLVSKENASNGGGRAIRPAASIICGFWDRGPVEVPFKITV